MSNRTKIALLISLLLLFVAACQPSANDDNDQPAATTAATDENESSSAYPGAAADPAYPAPTRALPENLSDTPPNPERDLPEAQPDRATIGGVLVREILDEGFVPLNPVYLILGEVVYNTEGEPGFIASRSNSPRAELFPTGVFVFRDIPPGEYGLVVDLVFTSFPILNDEGVPLVIEASAGQVMDLGQIITIVPGDE